MIKSYKNIKIELKILKSFFKIHYNILKIMKKRFYIAYHIKTITMYVK